MHFYAANEDISWNPSCMFHFVLFFVLAPCRHRTSKPNQRRISERCAQTLANNEVLEPGCRCWLPSWLGDGCPTSRPVVGSSGDPLHHFRTWTFPILNGVCHCLFLKSYCYYRIWLAPCFIWQHQGWHWVVPSICMVDQQCKIWSRFQTPYRFMALKLRFGLDFKAYGLQPSAHERLCETEKSHGWISPIEPLNHAVHVSAANLLLLGFVCLKKNCFSTSISIPQNRLGWARPKRTGRIASKPNIMLAVLGTG